MGVDFQPLYVLPPEYAAYGLPTSAQVANIDGLVAEASSAIDDHCGRHQKDAIGSLVYTTYVERRVIISDYNLVRLSQRPLASVDADTVATLQSLAASGQSWMYNNVQPNTQKCIDLSLSPIISASGRYGYRRHGQSRVAPDLNMGLNTLQVASTFGGPPAWSVIDTTLTSIDPMTGEVWFPAGLYLAQYTEVLVTYNSGYDPRYMPRIIKQACAQLVRNYLVRGGNTPSVKGLQGVGRITTMLSLLTMDDNIQKLLRGYCNIRAM